MRVIKTLTVGFVLSASLFVMACGGGDDASADDPQPTATTTASDPTGSTGSSDAEGVTLEVVAKDLKFDKTELTAPAETTVTVVLDNQDASVPHNIAFYETDAATEKIFGGKLISGPDSVTEEFETPAAGEYFFRCDAHPDTMKGTLTVE